VCKSSRISAIIHIDVYDYSLPFTDDKCQLGWQEKNNEIIYDFITQVGSLQLIAKYGYRALVHLLIEYL
jgi:hypothetical protein